MNVKSSNCSKTLLAVALSSDRFPCDSGMVTPPCCHTFFMFVEGTLCAFGTSPFFISDEEDKISRPSRSSWKALESESQRDKSEHLHNKVQEQSTFHELKMKQNQMNFNPKALCLYLFK